MKTPRFLALPLARLARTLAGQSFAAPTGMTRELATMDRMFGIMGSIPDPDEALRRAGIDRVGLRAVEMDDEVTAALDTRREAVLSTPWRLEGGTARWREELRAELAPHVENLLRCAFNAVPYGYSVAEVVYRNDRGRAGIASIAEKPFEWFDPDPNGVNLKFKSSESAFEGVPVDPRKFLLTVRAGTMRNPYGEALLSRVYWPWKFRMMGWQFGMRWLERYGTPLLLGKTAGDPQTLANNLAAAVDGAALAVGQGDDVQAITATGGFDHFVDFDNMLCRRIQKLILGQTLTTDASSGGSLAAAKVAQQTLDTRTQADLRMAANTVQRLVNALWSFNGRGGPAPTFVLADDTGLEAERAARDAILVEKVGVRLMPTYIANAYDLATSDFEMQEEPEPQPAALPPGPGPAEDGEDDDEPGRQQFSARKRTFTPVQQGIEDGLQNMETTDPISPELVREAVLAARDEDDLRARLAALVKETDPKFSQVLERASFAAAVLGYVAAEERRT